MNEKKIAMTDLETTGDIFETHEILEIGLVVFDPKTFEITDTMDVKTKPLHVENAIPAALQINGYNERDWEGAISLEEAMKMYSDKTEGCIMCAFNAAFDWGFLNSAFRKTKTGSKMDYHYLDLLSIAWAKGLSEKDKWTLRSACEMFGVPPEPAVHRAINGAMTDYELFKKLAKI